MMRAYKQRAMADITGQKFHRLTAIRREEVRQQREWRWHCRCDCGNESLVKVGALKSGATKSCGCYSVEATRRTHTKHGHSPHDSDSRTYQSWRGMMTRCYRKSAAKYARYGGRGITVCDRWHSFISFLADMGVCPDGLTIERDNNDGNYEPGNCRWATRAEQARNKSTTKLSSTVVIAAREMFSRGVPQAEIAAHFGVNKGTMASAISGATWANL